MRQIKLLLLLFYGTLPLLSFGQKQILPDKKMYIDPNGRVYFQKQAPVYFFVGTDPDKNKSTALKSETTPKYANPMYLDAEGLNTFRSPYAVDPVTKNVVLPKQDVIFEVYADGHSPVTHISYGTVKTLNKGGKLYINGKAQITLTARDEMSGVDKTYISIDSADYKEYTTPIALDDSKEYLIKYYSFDKVGNVEPLKTIKLVIDRAKPKTTFEIKGDKFENVLASNSSIIFTTGDNSSGIASLKVILDGKPLAKFTGTIHSSALSQGEHKIEYYAEDNVGNQEDPQTYEFYVDRTPPTILQDIIGKKYIANGKEFSSGRSQLKLTALDNKAGVKAIYYSINNSEYQLYEKPVFLKAVKGKMSVKAYAVDKLNNRSQVAEDANADRLPYVDLTGPSLKYRFTGPVFIATDTIYISASTKIHLSGFDVESGLNNIQYTVDNKDTITYSAPFDIATEGNHSIDYIGTDNVDNTTTQNLKVMVDTTGPVLFTRFSIVPKGVFSENEKTLNIYPSHVCLFVAATDVESGYDQMTYSLNGSPEKPFSGFLNGFPKKSEIIIKAYDKLGNETHTTLEFVISE